MSDVPFWQSKTLDEMSDAEWECCVMVAVSVAA